MFHKWGYMWLTEVYHPRLQYPHQIVIHVFKHKIKSTWNIQNVLQNNSPFRYYNQQDFFYLRTVFMILAHIGSNLKGHLSIYGQSEFFPLKVGCLKYGENFLGNFHWAKMWSLDWGKFIIDWLVYIIHKFYKHIMGYNQQTAPEKSF